MYTTFLAVMTPMLMLFICIVIGFISGKAKLVPESAASTVAKLENWIFCPALAYYSMANFFTMETLNIHAVNISVVLLCSLISMVLAILFARILIKTPGEKRNIYTYALAFANAGYMGDPLVLAIFGDEMLAHYKLACLPLTVLIFTWGFSLLIPKGKGKRNALKSFLNPSLVAMVLGMAVGILGLNDFTPKFLTDTIFSLKNCMGPLAMLLVGLTLSSYDLKKMLADKMVYVASLLRLIILPAIHVVAVIGLKLVCSSVFNFDIQNEVLIIIFFATATPLGLNTIVFPAAYDGDPSTGAGMAMISHALSILTIPFMYALFDMIIKLI